MAKDLQQCQMFFTVQSAPEENMRSNPLPEALPLFDRRFYTIHVHVSVLISPKRLE